MTPSFYTKALKNTILKIVTFFTLTSLFDYFERFAMKLHPYLEFFLVLFIVFGSFITGAVQADSIDKENQSAAQIIDCSENQLTYGEMVANYNRQISESPVPRSVPDEKEDIEIVQDSDIVAVLCRTTGEKIDFSYLDPIYIIAGPSNCFTLYFSNILQANKAVEALSDRTEIIYAEIDSAVEVCGDNSISFQSWGAEVMQYQPFLEFSAGCSSRSVTVAVIDSGLFLHPFYADRVLESGYDYVDADRDATNDLLGHGTNVAGIIADCTQGFPVFFYPIRILNESGSGSISNTINAVREAIQKGVDIINLSLEAKSISSALDDAVMDALAAGITVVAAAGNYSIDTAGISPGHITASGVIVVGAADADDTRSEYSNFGESVDLYTYGTDITCCSRSGGYTKATGTSIAAPHITGLAALLLLTHDTLTPENIELRIKNAVNTAAGIMTPRLNLIIPADTGFSLSLLRMNLNDRIQLPTQIRPLTAMEPIQYRSDHENVIVIDNGLLIPVNPGDAVISAECLGLPEVFFQVHVSESVVGIRSLEIPYQIKIIEQEAFSGCSDLVHVKIPDGVEMIGDRAFDLCASLFTIEIPDSVTVIGDYSFSDAVVICSEDSAAEEYAKNNHLPYIIRSN